MQNQKSDTLQLRVPRRVRPIQLRGDVLPPTASGDPGPGPGPGPESQKRQMHIAVKLKPPKAKSKPNSPSPRPLSAPKKGRLHFAETMQVVEPAPPPGRHTPTQGILRYRAPPPLPGASASVAKYAGHPHALVEFISRLHLDVWRGERMSTMLQQVLSVVLTKALFERLRWWRQAVARGAPVVAAWTERACWSFWCGAEVPDLTARGLPADAAGPVYVEWWKDTVTVTRWRHTRDKELSASGCKWDGTSTVYPADRWGGHVPAVPADVWSTVWSYHKTCPLPLVVTSSLRVWLACMTLTLLGGLYAEDTDVPVHSQDVFHRYASHSPSFQAVLSQLSVQW